MKKMRVLMMSAVVAVAFGAMADGPAFGSGVGRSGQLGSGARTEEETTTADNPQLGSGALLDEGGYGLGYLVETYVDVVTGETVVLVIPLQ